MSRASTLCCDWLAWASMAVAACAMICVRASSVEALAKSVSCTRLREAEVLVETLVKLPAGRPTIVRTPPTSLTSEATGWAGKSEKSAP